MLKQILTVVALVAISAIAASAMQAPKSTTGVPASSTKDEDAIRQVVQKVEDGWNAHDGAAFAAQFAEDADYVVVNGSQSKGRKAIEQGHAGIFASIYKDSTNKGTIQNIRFLRPDVAVVHVEWNLEFKVDGEVRKGHAINTMVMTKEDDQWQIAAFQNTPVQDMR